MTMTVANLDMVLHEKFLEIPDYGEKKNGVNQYEGPALHLSQLLEEDESVSLVVKDQLLNSKAGTSKSLWNHPRVGLHLQAAYTSFDVFKTWWNPFRCRRRKNLASFLAGTPNSGRDLLCSFATNPDMTTQQRLVASALATQIEAIDSESQRARDANDNESQRARESLYKLGNSMMSILGAPPPPSPVRPTLLELDAQSSSVSSMSASASGSTFDVQSAPTATGGFLFAGSSSSALSSSTGFQYTGSSSAQPNSGFAFLGSTSSGTASATSASASLSSSSSARGIGWSGTSIDGSQSNWSCYHCFLSNVDSATICVGCKNSKLVREQKKAPPQMTSFQAALKSTSQDKENNAMTTNQNEKKNGHKQQLNCSHSPRHIHK